jgi:DNA-cytosine methyltransferase
MKIASLFTGVGMAEIGFERAFGKENVEHVAFCEFDDMASRVLAHRFPGVPNFGDITEVDWEKFPKCDLLHSSNPCQAFSVAGKQQGMEDSRGGALWEAYFKCLEVVRPPVFTLEEVPPLAFSKKFEKEWAWIMSEWTRLGYKVKYTKINGLDHGVPQNRLRLIAVGFHDHDRADRFEFPKPQPRTLKLNDILQPDDEVDVKYYLKGEAILKLLNKMTEAQIERLMSIGNTNAINPFTAESIDHARTIRTGGKSSLIDKHNYDTIGIVIDRGCIRPRENSTCQTATQYKGLDQHGARTGVAIVEDFYPDSKSIFDNNIPTLRSDRQGLKVIVPAELRRRGKLTERVASPTLRAESKRGDSQKHPFVPEVKERIVGWSETKDRFVPFQGDKKRSTVQESIINKSDSEEISALSVAHSGRQFVVVEGSNGKPYVIVGDKTLAIRRLTPRETERLQSIPDDHTLVPFRAPTKKNPDKVKMMSDSQRYRQIGNGLVSNVIEAVAKKLIHSQANEAEIN